ncbi:MAG: homoserine dehydrogenase, partial [Alphaproteobacteria bacterium]|nr:homoserine dehydrogenase [Alphaproteobacteria bacterium]
MFKIGLVGLGTVGGAVAYELLNHADKLSHQAGRQIKLVAVHARDRAKKRACPIPDSLWADDPLSLPTSDVDAVIELVGGAQGLALDLAQKTLKAGKIFITANKALIATHAKEIHQLMSSHHGCLYAEAMVAGAIPVLKTMREALAANTISSVQGILNGTCNFILTQMEQQGLDYAQALTQAQAEGYAEADPALDVEGGDTAHKLAILAGVAVGAVPQLSPMRVEGINRILPVDLATAKELGYRIKLLGVAQFTPQGLIQWVGPCLVSQRSLLAQVHGAENAV